MAKLDRIALWVILATPLLLLIVFGAMRLGGPPPAELVMLSAALVLVIQATLVVSLTAEGSDTLSATTGILGAIAGYLFGRSQDRRAPEPQQGSLKAPERAGATQNGTLGETPNEGDARLAQLVRGR